MTAGGITEGELLEMAQRVRKLEDVIERVDFFRLKSMESLRHSVISMRERDRLDSLGIELDQRLEAVVEDFNRLQSIVRR